MNPQIQLNLVSSNKESLFLYKTVLIKIFTNLNLKFTCFNLPTKKQIITLNKSPHVNKTTREQFQLEKHKVVFQVSNFISGLTLRYIFLNKPKTTTIKIKKLI